MTRIFIQNFGPFSLSELALKIDAELHGDKKKVLDIASLDEANDQKLVFIIILNIRMILTKQKQV